jgi:hypothetical protein
MEGTTLPEEKDHQLFHGHKFMLRSHTSTPKKLIKKKNLSISSDFLETVDSTLKTAICFELEPSSHKVSTKPKKQNLN